MKAFKRPFFLSVFLAAAWLAGPGPVPAATVEPAGGYHVVQKVPLPGDGGWDFLALDSESRRLYVTHADSVQVLDADSLKLIGTVEKIPHPHGILVLPELGKGYATSGDPGSVVVFDLKTFRRLSEIPSHKDTDVILYDKPSGRIFTFNGDSHESTVIDPQTDKVVKFLPLGGDPEFAVSDGMGRLFNNIESKSQVLRINPKTLRIEKRWQLKDGATPSGLAMDVANHRLFIGCRKKVMVVLNAENGREIQRFPIGEHVDATVFDPASQMVFDSCGDGTLSVFHEDSPDKITLVEKVRTEPGAKTMAFDPQTGRIFLSTALREEASQTPTGAQPGRGIAPGTFHVLVVGK